MADEAKTDSAAAVPVTDMNAGPGVTVPSAQQLDTKIPTHADTRQPTPAGAGVSVVEARVADNGRLYVIVQGPTITSVQSLGARTLAYNERFKHGFGQAGISAAGAAYPCNPDGSIPAPSKEIPRLWRHVYELRAG